MKSTDNIYIDALKFGVAKMQTGITFNEMLLHLEGRIGWKIDEKYRGYLKLWFLKNFYNNDVSPHVIFGNPNQVSSVVNDAQNYNGLVCVMTAEAYETLLDYEKLQQTRNDSKRAQKLAIIAIWISALMAAAQIVLQVYFAK